mgnify:FL=1
MKGLIYQLKSVRKDKFCIMSFLLPIVVAVALNFVGSIDLSSLGEFHFGVTATATTSEVNTPVCQVNAEPGSKIIFK